MPRRKTVIDEKHVMSLKVVGLRKLCKKYKLASKGRKAVLQDRILEHLLLGKYTVSSEISENSGLETGQSTVELKELQQNKICSIEVSKEPSEIMMAEPEKKISLPESTAFMTVSDDLNEKVLNQEMSSVDDVDSNDVSKAVEDNLNDIMKEKPPAEKGNQMSEQKLTPVEETTGTDGDIGIISEEVAVSNKAELKIERPKVKPVIIESVVEKPTGVKRKSSEAIRSFENISNKKRKTCELVEPDLCLNSETGGHCLEAVDDQADSEIQVQTTVNVEKDMKAEAEVQSEVVEHAEAEAKEAEARHDIDEESNERLPGEEKMKSNFLIEEQLEKSADQDVMEEQGMKNLIAQSALKVQHHEEKSTQPSKPSKNKNWGRKFESQENYHRRYHGKHHQSRRDQNRRRNRNRGNWNRNRNWNGGNQQAYEPSQRWLFRQDNWSGNSQHMMNSMPVSQQRRHWNPSEGWQQQRSYYQGGYGSFSARSGRGRGWGRGGGWQDRRNGRWRGNTSGKRGQR